MLNYTDHLYNMLFKENSLDKYALTYDSKKLEKIKKASQKILLNTQKVISESFRSRIGFR